MGYRFAIPGFCMMITSRLLPLLLLPLLFAEPTLAQFTPPPSTQPLETGSGGTRVSEDTPFEIFFAAPDQYRDAIPMETRGGSSSTRGNTECQAQDTESDLPILALTSSSGGYTVTGSPSFAIFMPQTSADYASLEIYSEDLNEIILQLDIKLPEAIADNAGILQIKAPPELVESLGLKAGEAYWWAFTPYCSNSFQTLTATPAWTQGEPSHPYPSAWIARVEVESEAASPPGDLAPLDLAIWYAERGVWFDTVDVLIEEMENPASMADADRAHRLWSQLIEPQLANLQAESGIETDADLREIADMPIIEIAPEDVTLVFPIIPSAP